MTARPLQQGDYVQIHCPGDDYDALLGYVTGAEPDGRLWVTPQFPQGSWRGPVPKKFRPSQLSRIVNPPTPPVDSKDPT